MPDPNASLFHGLFRPFQGAVWLCGLSALVVIVVVLWVSAIVKKDNEFTQKLQCVQYFVATLLQQGSPQTPRSYAGRLLVSTFWFSVITLAAVYSGNLVAFLASSDRTTPFTNLEDVAQQTDYQIGTAEGGSPEMLLRTTEREPYKTIASLILNSSNIDILHPDTLHHLEKVFSASHVLAAFGYAAHLSILHQVY
ncbi:hypothetical protein CAPTEDRAFT_216536 [Capitella teleta]|uniref:Ionotropic glutamate receptor C-terminal domain-containing protein n=1 Tax=Capitella teleta TaxID=283909 RepID=R7UTD1_CAPTE|nr:hypothetical protein CAPTEDRAFT_216536 [Capitella teleta]|eukprot:ELU07172.1 hypothetical protein CAPTEDRAFT_216536 [Capitella teleta]